MTDRELLELAAKAYGAQGLEWRYGSGCYYYDDPETGREEWNPLVDDGQALRLAAKLDLLDEHPGFTYLLAVQKNRWGSALVATRWAIVCAAADIGMECHE